MKLMIKLILLSFFFFSSSYAAESSDAFIVKIYDQKVRVLSPTSFDPELNVIIENKMMTNLKGKVVTESESSVKFISLEAGRAINIKLINLDKEKIFFIPISPPLQKVELKLGNKPYEIPPRS